MVGGDQIPSGGIELILPGETLAIGAHGHDDRKGTLFIRTIDVGAENGAVRQGDRQVPVDAHTVAQFCPGPALRPARFYSVLSFSLPGIPRFSGCFPAMILRSPL